MILFVTFCNHWSRFDPMKNDLNKPEISYKERRSIWKKWVQNLKDWIWYHQEHPDWFDIDIQHFVYVILIRPLQNLWRHIKELHRDRSEAKLPETESRIGQLLLFLWGNLPRTASRLRERLLRRRRKAIHTDSKRRSFFEQLQIHPVMFLFQALLIALAAVILSLYTLGTSAKYSGVALGTVSSKADVAAAVAKVESITQEALRDKDFALDPELLETQACLVLRTDIASSTALEENLSEQLGLVEYGYALYVDGELIAATTFPGALEEMLEQLQIGYHTPNTVECGLVEKVEIIEEYVDASHMMNLGSIAEILNDTKVGAVTYKVVSGDSFYRIAMEHDLTVSALRNLNPGYSATGLHPGDVLLISNAVPFLTVLNVERQAYVEDVPYGVEYVDDPDMYQGDYRVISKGVYGKADVTANVTYINGQESDRQIVASATLSEPIAEVQARGTKPRPTWYPTGSFRWPASGVITSYFGYRDAPTSGASYNHGALDIGNRIGTPIYAADGGTVTYAGWYSGYGYTVEITHNNTGFVTLYAHCNALYVSAGDKVYKGEQIAAMGSTGISTGSHLHFEMRKNGTKVDPLNYLP